MESILSYHTETIEGKIKVRGELLADTDERAKEMINELIKTELLNNK